MVHSTFKRCPDSRQDCADKEGYRAYNNGVLSILAAACRNIYIAFNYIMKPGG